MYKTILINFGNIVYEGTVLMDAENAAKNAGFEAAIYKDNELIATYSPISGWRNFDVNE